MPSLRQYLLPATLYAALGVQADSGYGNFFYFGPWSSSQPASPYLSKATYSLTVPAALSNYDTSDSSLWVAIWVGVQPNSDDVMNADLVQPLLNWCADQTSCGCDASTTEWCVAASTYTPEGQLGESYVAVAVGDVLDFEISLTSDGVYQSVSKDGEIISSRTDSSFYPGTLYGANECSSAACGTLPAYTWDNLTMTFSEALTDLSSYEYGSGSSMSTPVSSEGGKVWTISEVSIEKNAEGAVNWSD